MIEPTGNYYLDKYGTPSIGDVQQLPVPDTEQEQPTGNYYLDKYGTPDIKMQEPVRIEESDYGWGIVQAFKRGGEMLAALPDLAQGDYEELAGHFQRMEELERSDEDAQKLRAIQETEGWWDTTVEIFKNPKLIAQVVAESLPNMLAPATGGIIGGLGGAAAGTAIAGPPGTAIGAVAGTMTGAALGSFATEYLHGLSNFLTEEGVDMTSAQELKAAFANDELMLRAKEKAALGGLPVAVFDGLSFGLAGRIYKPGSAIVKAVTGGGEVGMQAGFGMAGEAGKQLLTEGEITSKADVLYEGIAEIPGAIVEPLVRKIVESSKAADDDALSGQLKESISGQDLDAMIAAEFSAGPTDTLSMQASGVPRVEQQTEADLAVSIREDEQRSENFLRMEADRDARLIAQRREAEYQQELQKGEVTEAQPVTREDIVKASKSLPGVSLGEAIRKAQKEQVAEKTSVEKSIGDTSEIVTSPSSAKRNIDITESASNGVRTDVKFFGNSANAETIRVKGFNSLDRKTQHVVLSKVRTALNDTKIFQSIIKSIPIDVMNTLIGEKTTPKILLNNPSMLTDRLTVSSKESVFMPVSSFIDSLATSFETTLAKSGTEETGLVLPSTESASDVTAAERASESEDLQVFTVAGQQTAANIKPTEGQIQAGNYRKGSLTIEGLPITIENPEGSVRFKNQKLKDHYGYIKRTEGADGDQVDVFVNPKIEGDFSGNVYVVDQTQEDGVTFDEHKVMLGYANQLDAVRAYKRNYEKGWHVGPVTEMTMPEFKTWLEGSTKTAVQGKPSRQERKFIRDKKGHLRFSRQQANKAILIDAKTAVPGANVSFLQSVLGKDYAGETASVVEVETTEQVGELDKITMEVKRINKLFRSAKIQFVNFKDLPKELHDDMKQNLFDRVVFTSRGVTELDTGKIWIFKDRVHSVRQMRKLAMHEMFHKGLRVAMPEMKINALLDDFYKNMSIAQKTHLQNIKLAYGLDFSLAKDRREGVEEVLANIAETDPKSTVLRRFIAAIREFLVKYGIITAKDKWTDADIAALIAEAHGALRRKHGRPISEVKLTEAVQVTETDEVFDIEINAETILRQHDKRVDVVKKLRACL